MTQQIATKATTTPIAIKPYNKDSIELLIFRILSRRRYFS